MADGGGGQERPVNVGAYRAVTILAGTAALLCLVSVLLDEVRPVLLVGLVGDVGLAIYAGRRAGWIGAPASDRATGS